MYSNDNEIKTINTGIELIRFLASCGIVWFHVGAPGATFAYGGLPIFMIFSIAFLIKNDLSTVDQFQKSIRRLIYPWIFWSGIYAVGKISEAIISGSPVHEKFHYWMCLTGTSIHLWYLPFAFCSIMILTILKNHFNLRPERWNSTKLAIIGGLLLPIISCFFTKIISYVPFAQWLFILPAIPVGIFFATIKYNTLSKQIINNGLWIIIICYIIVILMGWKGLGIPYFVAIIGCAIAWQNNCPTSKTIRYLGNISYGIYFVHGLFVSFWIHVGIKKNSFELITLTIISSIFFVAVLHKTKLKKFI